MYKCDDCGYIFDEPVRVSEDRTPGGAFEGGSFIETWEECPNCGGSFEEYDESEEYDEEEYDDEEGE